MVSAVNRFASDDLNRLKLLIEQIVTPLLGGFDSYVLFDAPVHNNVGDSAILLGELAFLRRHFGCDPAYLCRADRCDYNRIAKRHRSSLILINGGGNFGDVWPELQRDRETLLERFPGRPIIQFPQTIYYESTSALARTSEIIKRHGNFTLLVRDERSFDLARSAFDCSVLLCPDMAFALDPIQNKSSPTLDLLLLMRRDQEARRPLNQLNVDSSVRADWPDDSRPLRALRQVLAMIQTIGSDPRLILKRDELNNKFLEIIAENRFAVGVALLSSARMVISDRLHASIMSMLLGIPCVAVDNSYGKVSGFLSLWLPELVQMFDTFEDALGASLSSV